MRVLPWRDSVSDIQRAGTKATTRANTSASHQPNTPCSNHATGTGNSANKNNTAPPTKGTAAIFCKPSHCVRTVIMRQLPPPCFTSSILTLFTVYFKNIQAAFGISFRFHLA